MGLRGVLELPELHAGYATAEVSSSPFNFIIKDNTLIIIIRSKVRDYKVPY